MFYKVLNGISERVIDENGYLHVKRSPILKSGILEYLGSELKPEGSDEVDGVKVEDDKIYKVYISPEELDKGLDSFKLLPIVDGHTWLGEDGEDAKDFQEGTTGENVYIEDGMIYAPLMFTGKKIIDEIVNHHREELSSSYQNVYKKADNPAYDFVATDIKGNHLALVDRGRCGSAVRVLNSNIEKGVNQMPKTANEAILELDGKRINLDRFFEEEKKDEGDTHDDSIVENEDKREVIREIMAVAAKNPDEFAGGDEEKVREIAKLAEKLAYKPSETSETDNEDLEDGDKEKAPAEDDKGEKSENPAKAMNYDAIYTKVSNAIRKETAKAEAEKVKAYNTAREVIGDFNPFGMSEKDMYVKALNHFGVALEGKESVSELSAMLKACASVRSKVDNGFTYNGSTSSDEVEFNI